MDSNNDVPRYVILDLEKVRAVSVNHRSMEAPRLADPATTEAFYEAYAAFVGLLDADDAVVELALGPGDLVAFDNRRVLHGRSGFSADARRHLQGCYIDIDAVRSTARRAVTR